MLQILEGVTTQCIAKQTKETTGHSWSVFLEGQQLVQVARALLDAAYSLEDIFAQDFQEGFLVIYHFNLWTRDERVTLRVLVPHATPTIPSISEVFQGAEWHERETRDFHGVIFEGNPNLVPLLMAAEDKDVHPLVKTAKKRKSIKDVLNQGEILFCDKDIEALFAEEEAENASEA